MASEEMKGCRTPPFSAVKPIKAGMLVKRGDKVKSWKQRLFLLEGKFLYYYITENDERPRGVIFLEDIKVEEEPDIGKQRKCSCFSLTTAKSWNVGDKKLYNGRTYYLCCDSFTEMSDWMSLLVKCTKWDF